MDTKFNGKSFTWLCTQHTQESWEFQRKLRSSKLQLTTIGITIFTEQCQQLVLCSIFCPATMLNIAMDLQLRALDQILTISAIRRSKENECQTDSFDQRNQCPHSFQPPFLQNKMKHSSLAFLKWKWLVNIRNVQLIPPLVVVEHQTITAERKKVFSSSYNQLPRISPTYYIQRTQPEWPKRARETFF